MNPIEIGVLRLATEKIVKAPHFEEKINWWLRSAHSIERWFQFEWAFQLQKVLGENFLVICEKKWIDVVICHPKDQERIEAAIEIKWYENWCINEGYHLKNAVMTGGVLLIFYGMGSTE